MANEVSDIKMAAERRIAPSPRLSRQPKQKVQASFLKELLLSQHSSSSALSGKLGVPTLVTGSGLSFSEILAAASMLSRAAAKTKVNPSPSVKGTPPVSAPKAEAGALSRPVSESASAQRAASAKESATGALPFGELISSIAEKHKVDPALVAAVVKAESGFNPTAESSVGAKGLMQLMDGTARTLGVTNSFDPAQNLDGGIRFLGWLLDKYGGDMKLALAGYNAGSGAVDSFGGIPPYKETQTFVSRVLDYWKNYKTNFGQV